MRDADRASGRTPSASSASSWTGPRSRCQRRTPSSSPNGEVHRAGAGRGAPPAHRGCPSRTRASPRRRTGSSATSPPSVRRMGPVRMHQPVVPAGAQTGHGARSVATEPVGDQPLASRALVEVAGHLPPEGDREDRSHSSHRCSRAWKGSGRQIRSATMPVHPVSVGCTKPCSVSRRGRSWNVMLSRQRGSSLSCRSSHGKAEPRPDRGGRARPAVAAGPPAQTLSPTSNPLPVGYSISVSHAEGRCVALEVAQEEVVDRHQPARASWSCRRTGRSGTRPARSRSRVRALRLDPRRGVVVFLESERTPYGEKEVASGIREHPRDDPGAADGRDRKGVGAGGLTTSVRRRTPAPVRPRKPANRFRRVLNVSSRSAALGRYHRQQRQHADHRPHRERLRAAVGMHEHVVTEAVVVVPESLVRN